MTLSFLMILLPFLRSDYPGHFLSLASHRVLALLEIPFHDSVFLSHRYLAVSLCRCMEYTSHAPVRASIRQYSRDSSKY
jgi:hypothetical protein